MSNRPTRALEFATRKKIDLMLTNLGWNTDEEDPSCNAFAGRAKNKDQNKQFKGKQPDYVLYQMGSDIPVAIIEAKRKGESIEAALKQAEDRYARPLGVKIIFAYDGAFFKSWHIDFKKELFSDGEAITQLITEKRLLRFIQEGHSISELTPKVKHSRAELISIFKWANELLREEGLREGIERFTEFANLLFLKLISELEQEREREGEPSILPEDCRWEEFCNENDKRMLNYINDTVLPRLVDEYNGSGDVFQHKLQIKNPATLKSIVDRLSKVNLMDADTDVKGDAFEYFLKDSITVGNDLGEYFTPRHIVNLMIELIEPQFGEKIYDPTCGTGGFLIAAFNYVKKRIAKTKDNLTTLKGAMLYGREISKNSKIAKMNMILTGDGHNNIVETDSLAKPFKEQFNVVLANPPYGQKTKYGHLYPVPSNSGDAIFIQHIFLSMKEGGRAAVVVPEGLLFASSEMDVRKYLLKNCNIKAIISLPQGVFRPYASSKTNIMVFEKNKTGTKSIWFYNLEADGFDLSSDFRRPMAENDIPDLLSKWSDKVESDKSWNIKIERIEENKYDLLAKTYQPRKQRTSQFPAVSFSEIMKEDTTMIKITDDKEYRRLTVRFHGNGVVYRDTISGKNLKTKQQKFVKKDQLIVAEIDAKEGAFGVVPEELESAIVSSHYFLFDPDTSKILPKYLDYMMRYGSYQKLIQPFVKGTTNYASIRSRDILKLKIPLPDMNTQELIVKRIQKQETVIENANATIASLREAIVDSSDFEGNWKLHNLEDVCIQIVNGGTPSRNDPSYFGGDISWVKSGELEDGVIEKTEETLTKKGIENSNAKILPKGTVLVALIGATVGRTGLLAIDGATNQNVVGFVPNQSIITSKYLMYFLRTMRPYYIQKARGIAQPALNTSMIKSVKVPVPASLDAQYKIVDTIEGRQSILAELEKVRIRAFNLIRQIIWQIGEAGYDTEPSDKKIKDFFDN